VSAGPLATGDRWREAMPPAATDRRLDRLRRIWSNIEGAPPLAAARAYAKELHQLPLDYYVARVRNLGLRGQCALDAGCGTGQWSFALRATHDEVFGIDISAERLAFARWLGEAGAVEGVSFREASILDTGLPDASVDTIFCYGVLISSIPVASALAEFRRVLRPGGIVYVCLNGPGWSHFLRDERSRDDRRCDELGRQGIYNDLVSRVPTYQIALFCATAAPISAYGPIPRYLVEAAPGCEDRGAVTYLQAATLSAAPEAIWLEAMFSRLAWNRISVSHLQQAARFIEIECGPAYVARLARDLSEMAAGRRTEFSYTDAGRGYLPDEIEGQCGEAGLIDFQWACEGCISGSTDAAVAPIYEGYFNGRLRVWEFLAFRPETGLGCRLSPKWFLAQSRLLRQLASTAQGHTALVTNVDCNAFPHPWVAEARRRGAVAGGDAFVADLGRRISAGASGEEEIARRLTRFVQDVLFHPPLSQPLFQNGSAELDPAALLFIGAGRCASATALLCALLRGAGLAADTWNLPGHVTVTAEIAGRTVVLEADHFKHGQFIADADGNLIEKEHLLAQPRIADGLIQCLSWSVNHSPFCHDLWGRRVIGYIREDGKVPLYSSYFGADTPRFVPRVPVLSTGRRGTAIELTWADATPADDARVEYLVRVRARPRGWNFDEVPDQLDAVALSAAAAPDDIWATERSALLDGSLRGYVSVVPRLVDHPDAFCWPSNEVRVGD
jgi:SAM-dependent methyltransferase